MLYGFYILQQSYQKLLKKLGKKYEVNWEIGELCTLHRLKPSILLCKPCQFLLNIE